MKTTIKCPECTDTFTAEGDLKEHVKQSHKKMLVFECKGCDVKFKSKEQMIIHIKSKNKFKEGIFIKCNKCTAMFHSYTILKEHMKGYHS